MRGALLLSLLFISSAAAQYVDARDASQEGLDIVALNWSDAAGVATVALELAGTPRADAGYTAIRFWGTAGSPEPDAWTVLHAGPGGDSAVHGHAPAQEVSHNITRDGFILRWQFDSPFEAACSFAVARSVTYPEGGQRVEDVIGWSSTDIGDAWNDGRACSGPQPSDVVIEAPSVNTTPGPGLLLVLLAVALARR